jgi:hypothetical protein
LLAAILLQLLQFVQVGGEGTLQAGALPANFPQHGELFFSRYVGGIDVVLAFGKPREEALGGGHLFEVEPLGEGLRLPFSRALSPY